MKGKNSETTCIDKSTLILSRGETIDGGGGLPVLLYAKSIGQVSTSLVSRIVSLAFSVLMLYDDE